MTMKAILASLILGSSSLAAAAPAAPLSAPPANTYTSGWVGDHRADDNWAPNPHPSAQPSWPAHWRRPSWLPAVQPSYGQPSWRLPPGFRPVTLANDLQFAHRGRAFIPVGSQAGRFGSLQINAAGGRTLIQQVYVQFDNGQVQVVRNLNRTLFGNQSLSLDLDGNRRAIRRIVVYGQDLNSGWRRSPGAFSVTAA